MTIKPSKLFYLHVGKTAGTSMNSFLSSHFPAAKALVHVESNPEWNDKSRREYFAEKDFISGHVSIKQFADRFDKDAYFKFGTFRKPIDHIISHLAWVRHLSEPGNELILHEHPSWVQKISHDLGRIVLSDPEQIGRFILGMDARESALFDNAQSRYLLRLPGSVKVRKIHLADALSELKTLDFIGLTEYFDETVLTLCSMVGWKLPQSVQQQNVSQNKYGMNKNDEAFRKALYPLIWADILVYQRAAQLFRKTMETQLLGASPRTQGPALKKGRIFNRMARSVTGCFDKLERRKICGWAFYESKPDIPAYLKVCLPKQSFLIKADSDRKDLLKKGLHETGRCGFVLDLPDGVLLNPGDKIDVVAVGSGKRLKNSPRIFV